VASCWAQRAHSANRLARVAEQSARRLHEPSSRVRATIDRPPPKCLRVGWDLPLQPQLRHIVTIWLRRVDTEQSLGQVERNASAQFPFELGLGAGSLVRWFSPIRHPRRDSGR
jgi:hypothetical protein